MRVRTSEDGNGVIMNVSDALNMAEDFDSSTNLLGDFDMATKKTKTPKADEAAAKDAKPKGKKAPPPNPRAVPEGHTGIADIAKELKLSPAVVRRKLRSSEITKPEAGWHWKDGSKDLAAVKKVLTAEPKAKE